MPFYLIQRFVANGEQQPQYVKERFSTEPEAVMRACSHYAVGFQGDFVIEDDDGNVITNEQAIRKRCKATQVE